MSNRFFIFILGSVLPIVPMMAVWELPPNNFPASGSSIGMHSDANGNAIVVLDNSGTVEAFYYSQAANAWTGPTNLGSDNGTVAMDMDPSGTAIAVWIDPNGTDLHSSFFDGTAWTTASPDPFASSASAIEPIVTMNGSNSALATWVDDVSGNFLSSFFSAGSWGSTITIAGPLLSLTPTSSDYSSNGTAVATFTDGSNLLAANFDPVSSSWQFLPGSTLDTSILSVGKNEVARIDANGHAAVVWDDSTLNIKASTFNGTQWLPSVVLSPFSGNVPSSISFDMAPMGTGVVVWVNTGEGFSSSYNGSTWSSPQVFGIPISTSTSISVNASGDALLLFQSQPFITGAGVILSERLPLNGVWSQAEFLFNPLFAISFLTASLSDNGFGFAAWAEGSSYFATVEIVTPPPPPAPPAPPASIAGTICKNKFATQTDCVITITWKASPTPTVVAYQVFRNGILVATISATDPLVFVDHNRCKKTSVYAVVAIDSDGIASTPSQIVFN